MQARGLDMLSTRDIGGVPGESINDHRDAGVAWCCRFWRIGNEIHSQAFLGLIWDGDGDIPREYAKGSQHMDSKSLAVGHGKPLLRRL